MADDTTTPPSADNPAERPAPPAAAPGAAPGPEASAEAAASSADASPKPAAAAKKPVPARPAAAKAAAKGAAGDDKKLAGRTTTAAAARKPAAARKKKAAIPDDSPLMGRRGWMGLAWGSFTAATAGCLAATGRFMFPNVLNEPPQQFAIGFPEDYGEGVDERFKDRFGVWIVRTDNDFTHEASGFYALFSVCTHLGCTPNWLSAENKFKCPCHGSGFRPTGVNFEGPAPRPLERTRIVRAEDGQILVDKSRKFQQELGQWTDPESFLPI